MKTTATKRLQRERGKQKAESEMLNEVNARAQLLSLDTFNTFRRKCVG